MSMRDSDRNAETDPSATPLETDLAPQRDLARLSERRLASRFPREPGTDFAVIWQTLGDEILAEVHDESLTGLGLLLKDLGDLREGSQVDVVYTGSLMRGEVRHIEAQFDGTFLVGLSCERLFPQT